MQEKFAFQSSENDLESIRRFGEENGISRRCSKKYQCLTYAVYLLDKYKLSADHQTVIKAAYDELVKERAGLTDRVKEKELKRDELTMRSLRRNLNSLPMLSSRLVKLIPC